MAWVGRGGYYTGVYAGVTRAWTPVWSPLAIMSPYERPASGADTGVNARVPPPDITAKAD